jgi:hypothetical protein
MSVLNNVPIPLGDPIARRKRAQFGDREDPNEGILTDPWARWFDQLNLLLESTPSRIKTFQITNQGASIPPTDLSGGTLSGGLYRVSYYARITQAASTSSTLTVTIDWIDGGITPSYSGAAITGNTVFTNQSGTLLIKVDDLSPIRGSTTYGSVGGTPMLYAISVTLEEISA